jgi:hypothetical protein
VINPAGRRSKQKRDDKPVLRTIGLSIFSTYPIERIDRRTKQLEPRRVVFGEEYVESLKHDAAMVSQRTQKKMLRCCVLNVNNGGLAVQ